MEIIEFSTVYLSMFPSEIFFILALWLVASAYAFKSGISRISALSLALIVAGLFFIHLPATWPFTNVSGAETTSGWASSIVVFAALVLGMIFIMRRIGVDSYMDNGRPAASAIAALAFVVIALAFWAHTPAISSFQAFPTILSPFFTTQYFFWWIMGSLGTLAALSQNRMW